MSVNELIKIIKDRFEYRDGGLFVKYKYAPGVKVGERAGTANTNGYRHIQIKSKLYYEHRLIWLLSKGAWPKGQIDHVNHVICDNRIENLRDVSASLNQQNQIQAQRHNKLGVLGVSWHKQKRKYHARIFVNGKLLHLGYFARVSEASEAYQNAKEKHHQGALFK